MCVSVGSDIREDFCCGCGVTGKSIFLVLWSLFNHHRVGGLIAASKCCTFCCSQSGTGEIFSLSCAKMRHAFFNQAIMDGKKKKNEWLLTSSYTFIGIHNRLMGKNGSNFAGLLPILARNSPQRAVGAHGE